MDLRCGLSEAAPLESGMRRVAYCGFMENVRDYSKLLSFWQLMATPDLAGSGKSILW
jgi:hypothetical protein